MNDSIPIAFRERLWVGERCPYCRESITGGTLERVTCPGCRTAHHASCLEELGVCTILGCTRTFDQFSEPEGSEPQQQLLTYLKRNFVRHAEHLQGMEELVVEWEEKLPIKITARELRATRGVTDLLASSQMPEEAAPAGASGTVGFFLLGLAIEILLFGLVAACL